ncbi:hypothetical protein HWV07_17860 [Natronomonas salina]|uniref:hypothetical protein n=1 Tax=Natronomonas salina TaxID=1710540 RepID=UPI0015B63B5F|nr:hypothetical protein [Natronomonas salina]QLD90806.1 hypothetical protein HWV07_17860 [Natronomonas salina]
MNCERAVLVATVTILLGVTIVSGPLVGVSLTTSEAFDPGSGTIEASVTAAPETATLERGSHGAGVYYLRAAPIEVEIEEASGQPSLTYELLVTELGHTASSITFLDGDAAGTASLEFDASTLEADRVDAEAYSGVLRVIANDGDGERVLVERNVTVEVVE